MTRAAMPAGERVDIDAIEALLAKATPRPWAVENPDSACWFVRGADGTSAFDDGSACGEYGERCDPGTRDMIVALVNAAPALCAEVRALRAAQLTPEERAFFEAMKDAATTMLRGNSPWGWGDDRKIDRARETYDAMLAALGPGAGSGA